MANKIKMIEIDFIPSAMRYQVCQFVNGLYGVRDVVINSTMAAGMTISQASKWANRRNYKEVWGF